MGKYTETNQESKFRKTIFGAKKNVFTFAIGTAENPMGVRYSDEENLERQERFKKDLRRLRLKYYDALGRYNNDEHPLLIANINLDYCRYFFGPKKYDQESFIYGVVSDHKVYFYYFQQEDGKFEMLDSEIMVNETPAAENFFTQFRNFKFKVPFGIFENGLTDISERLEEDYGWNPKYRTYLAVSALTEKKTLRSIWEYNCSHLLTEKQEKARKARIDETKGFLH